MFLFDTPVPVRKSDDVIMGESVCREFPFILQDTSRVRTVDYNLPFPLSCLPFVLIVKSKWVLTKCMIRVK